MSTTDIITSSIEDKVKLDDALTNKNDNVSEIIKLITNIDKVQQLLTKNLCTIPKDQLVKLLKVLSALSNETQNVAPLNNILNCLNEVFKDGKLEIHEIPLLIKVLNDNVLKQNITNISSSDFSLLLKLLIIVLVELNIIKVNSTDLKIINALIDTSLELLNIQIHIPTKAELSKCFSWKC
jgi:hypothetical protein